MFVQRRMAPKKLRAARLAAGFTSINSVIVASELDGKPQIHRATYTRWEGAPGLASFDYNNFCFICHLFSVTPEQITDPIDAADSAEALA
ncbi:hypothetical protein Q0M94_28430 (plasmid) [Deinococcus radiomollis]|uniref:hypothetical protein n=1 Tax=Deinococcus radiomollis TaxID=468916 RepID=UPI003891A0A2